MNLIKHTKDHLPYSTACSQLCAVYYNVKRKNHIDVDICCWIIYYCRISGDHQVDIELTASYCWWSCKQFQSGLTARFWLFEVRNHLSCVEIGRWNSGCKPGGSNLMNRWNCDPWDGYLYPSICCVIIAVILLSKDAADVQEMERCGVDVAQLTATASWNTVVGYDRNTTNQIDSLIIHLQIWYRLLGTEDSCAVEFPGIELSWTHCVHVKLKPQGTSKLGAHMQKDHKRNTSCWHTHTRRKLTYYSVFASMNQLLSWFHAPGPDLKLTPGAKRTWWSIQAWEVSSSMLSGFVKSGKMPELYNTSCKPEAPASPVQKESL